MIAAVENAILARLKGAADEGLLGYRWETLETYPEDWAEYLKAGATWRAPAAWATFAGIVDVDRRDEGGVMARCTFGVVVAGQNKRNQEAARHGAGSAEPGSYQLMLDAIGLLDDSDLGIDELGPLQFRQAAFAASDAEMRKRGASLIALRFDADVPVAALTGDDDSLAPFATFHANWDVPPFGNVDGDPGQAGTQIPADASADATDHLEIQQ